MIIRKADVERAARSSSFSKYDSMLVKGVAIVLLMFHHSISMSEIERHTFNFFPFKSYHWPLMVCDSFKLCVGMFVFITAYGFYKSFSQIKLDNRSVFNWTGERLLKVLSGFWFVYILVFIITYAIDQRPLICYVTSQTKIEGSWVWAVLDFLGISHIVGTPSLVCTWWYMSAVVIMTIFFPLICRLGERFSFFVVGVAFILFPRIMGMGFPGSKNIFSFFLAYILGMAFAKYDVFSRLNKFSLIKKNKIISDIILFFVYMLAFFLIVVITDKLGRGKIWEFNYCISPVIVILFANRYLKRIPIINKALMFIGSHSLNIFLVHTFIRYVYLNDLLYSVENAILIPVILLIVSTAISVVIEFLKRLFHYNDLIVWVDKKLFSK